jgi:2-octaprenyl-6-methoxyphenol hydroxylase
MTRAAKDIYDVIVVGGGLAGLSLTALLAARGSRVLCLDRELVETQLSAAFDGRTTAVSWGSRKILAAAGVWDAMVKESCAINTIHILDGDSPVLLSFDREEVGGNSFGWIMENRFMRQALLIHVKKQKNATHIAPAAVSNFIHDDDFVTVELDDGRAFRAKLVVGADGRNSFTREKMGVGARQWAYNQRALAFVVAHENPHGNIAVEHFRGSGPFAILPMPDAPDGMYRSSVVWTEHGPDKKSARHFNDDVFNSALTARFPERYGVVKRAGHVFSFPLGLTHAYDYIARRMALVADAAHGIHPIAGQGLNLGFRDIAALAELAGGAKDPGDADLLQQYQRQRRFDNMTMAGATDMLTRLFSNDIGALGFVRRAGLRAVARSRTAKRFFMKQAMGASGLLPAMMRDTEAA